MRIAVVIRVSRNVNQNRLDRGSLDETNLPVVPSQSNGNPIEPANEAAAVFCFSRSRTIDLQIASGWTQGWAALMKRRLVEVAANLRDGSYEPAPGGPRLHARAALSDCATWVTRRHWTASSIIE